MDIRQMILVREEGKATKTTERHSIRVKRWEEQSRSTKRDDDKINLLINLVKDMKERRSGHKKGT